MTTVAKQVTVRGRVQGVWYRAWTVEHARALGLAGWVRNRSNGDVEALIEGEAGAVEALLERLWDGPPAARVDHIETSDKAPGALIGFEQRGTL